MSAPSDKYKCLDGNTLTPDELVFLATRPECKIDLTPGAWDRVRRARQTVDQIVKRGKPVYGVNTGFGKFESVSIPPHKLHDLQVNLIRSHSAGVGSPLTPIRARLLVLLRLNVLAKGHSGIRPESVASIVKAYNAGFVPCIPNKGTVGASGDLAPLSHLALGMIGEGKLATLNNLTWRPAASVLKELGVEPINLAPKEGLALINGTQFMSALGCEALVRARRLARQADVIVALSTEVLQGTNTHLMPIIHATRAHRGQSECAGRIRTMLDNKFHSDIRDSHVNCGRVQDAYSIRCAPQIHGVVCDMVRYVYQTVNVEINSATDNPLIFPDAETQKNQVVSGGNFHGEYPAKALDVLSIAVAELANVSERRIERLNNPTMSNGLPAFLINEGGLNSGFMIAHCTAGALTSENKVLVHPASSDTISTSAGQEDHVSMGGFAARKALKVVNNVEAVLAIELLCACQALDLHRPFRTTEPLERVFDLVRRVVPMWKRDEVAYEAIEGVSKLIREDKVWDAVADYFPTDVKFTAPNRFAGSKL